MPEFTRPRYDATVITTEFQITGQIEPIGPWLDYLNAKDKYTLPIHNARILAIGTSVGAGAGKTAGVGQSRGGLLHLPARSQFASKREHAAQRARPPSRTSGR